MENIYQQILQQSKRIEKEIGVIASDLSDQSLSAKPSLDDWSILEVIEHLSLVYDKYLANLDSVISAADSLRDGEQPRTKKTLLGRLSIFSQKPKKKKRKFKMKTFEFFTPTSEKPAHEIIAAFHSRKSTFHSLIERASRKQLGSAKVPTALGDRVKFYIAECFEFLIAHEERHLVQIQEVRKIIDKKRGAA